MPDLKFLLWNMEWMNDLFVSGEEDDPAEFMPDDAVPSHHRGTTVRERRAHLAGTLDELAPDVVVVVEGPNRAGELQLFFDEDVEGEWHEWSKWWQIADANRRKILAQASQIRLRFLDRYLTDEATREMPLIVCGDINDGPGLDASEKRLFGSGIERLMGTVWRPDLCLRNALFDSLTDRQRAELDFEARWTTSFQDPIFNNTWHREWIDHLLYTNSSEEPWVTNAEVHDHMPDGTPIWERYEHASDHYPVSATVITSGGDAGHAAQPRHGVRGEVGRLGLRFGGWFQCRLATYPDPADEPRGVSGFIEALPGDPNLDRTIRLQLSVTLVDA